MTELQKWEFIISLDKELLQGGIILSEWTTFLVKDAEIAYCASANLSCILACQAAIESHLRYEYFNSKESKGWGFYNLIENSNLELDLKLDLHQLRKFRNKWVHVENPSYDNDLLNKPEYYENELLNVATKSIKTMLRTIYSNQMI